MLAFREGQMSERRNSINIGVVGTGGAASYLHIPDDLKPAVRLTAIVDPSKQNRAAFVSLLQR
jgi:predicted dehydrogenase